ncbi:unnamed protein product, partial [Vitis vinifera]
MLNARQEAEVVFHMTVSSSILILKTPRIAAIVPWQLWGMLSTIAAGLAIDVYSPISGNADGIAEMAEMSHKICQRTDSRASMGGYISSQSVKKIIEINSYMLGTMAGRAAEDHIKLLHQPTYRNQREVSILCGGVPVDDETTFIVTLMSQPAAHLK